MWPAKCAALCICWVHEATRVLLSMAGFLEPGSLHTGVFYLQTARLLSQSSESLLSKSLSLSNWLEERRPGRTKQQWIKIKQETQINLSYIARVMNQSRALFERSWLESGSSEGVGTVEKREPSAATLKVFVGYRCVVLHGPVVCISNDSLLFCTSLCFTCSY